MVALAAVWWLGLLATPSLTSAHEIEVLPALLGTVTRPPEYLAKKAKDDRRKFREATCAFGGVGLISNLARLSFQLKNIVELCPKSIEDTLSWQPGDEATIPQKVCLLSTTAIVASLAQVSRSVLVLVSTCARTATLAEGCAASALTLLIPASLIINGGTIISAVCDPASTDLPKQIEPGRRLMDPLQLPKKRQADIAQCVFDAVDATRSIAAIGLALDAVGRSCPIDRTTRFREKLSTATCTVDVSILLIGFTRLVFWLALAVNHCSPEKERDAVCLAGVSAIAAGLATVPAGGAGSWATCKAGRKNKLIAELEAQDQEADIDVTAAAPFNVVRRRLTPDNSSAEIKHLEEILLGLGYNLSDHKAKWLQEVDSPDMVELRASALDTVRPGQTRVCSCCMYMLGRWLKATGLC